MNYRSDRETNLEIDLGDVRIASRNFEVRQLDGQVYHGQNQNPTTLQIGWQERITLHYLVIPTVTNACFSKVVQSNDNFACAHTNTHVTDFMCRERAHKIFTVSL